MNIHESAVMLMILWSYFFHDLVLMILLAPQSLVQTGLGDWEININELVQGTKVRS